MAKSLYRKKYCKDVKEYFLKFLDLRDDPIQDREAENVGMVPIVIEDGEASISQRPCSGYPTLTKFAAKIGVTTRTLRNWRDEFTDFDEACEFCEDIFDDVMDDGALFGKWDGRVAMKIRELKSNTRKTQIDIDGKAQSGDERLSVRINRDHAPEEAIKISIYEGKVDEDTEY